MAKVASWSPVSENSHAFARDLVSGKFIYFSECRNCKHYHYAFDFGYCGGFIIQDNTIFKTFDPCFCKELVPLDNLEYLEWKYEQKESKISQ